jgi:hypothetical protein
LVPIAIGVRVLASMGVHGFLRKLQEKVKR